MTEPVFNIISENVKKPHIPKDVKESSMEKHGGQKREKLLESCEVNGDFWMGVSCGNNPIKKKGLFQMRTLKELPQKNKNIDTNYENIDSREIL